MIKINFFTYGFGMCILAPAGKAKFERLNNV